MEEHKCRYKSYATPAYYMFVCQICQDWYNVNKMFMRESMIGAKC